MNNQTIHEKPTSRRARPSAPHRPSRHLNDFVEWYLQLGPHNLKNIRRHYTRNLFFKDPFTELYTIESLEKYYAKALEKVTDLRFVVENKMEESNQAFITWTMTMKMMGKDRSIHGVSHLKFDPSGLCEYHRDYFDVAEEVYEHLPILGFAFKGLKRVLQ